MKDYTFNKYIILGAIALVAVWQGLYYIIGNYVILPSPKDTLQSLGEIITSKYFLRTVLNTLNRTIVSFSIALFASLVLGIIAAQQNWFYDFISPMITLLKTVPTMAIVILALIWLTNEKAPILIATMMVFPILYEAVIQGITGIHKNIIAMTTLYQVKKMDIIRYVYIPNILNNIFSIFSSTIGLCLKLVIGGEVLGQPTHSIGTSIQTEKMYLNTAGVLAWIIILVMLSLMIHIIAKTVYIMLHIIRKGLKRERILY